MEFSLNTGTKGLDEMAVTETDTAMHYGSGLIEVFATPAMIALMEKTAQLSIQAQLPDGFVTVGTEIHITHSKASPLGARITCQTELIEINGKKLLFKVSAYDETGKIGEGTHHRYIINAKVFMERVTASIIK
ncbi:MAG: thioesterase family protein [Lentimicrobium sp.]|jgi:predicted thioesterase|nr:thioesterase family protein [Lentimicrobium sp.]